MHVRGGHAAGKSHGESHRFSGTGISSPVRESVFAGEWDLLCADCFKGTICRSAGISDAQKAAQKDDIISPILQDDFAGDYYGRRTIISKNRN